MYFSFLFFLLFLFFFLGGIYFVGSYTYMLECFFINSDYLDLSFVFFFDYVSFFFFSFVSLISSVVFLYSSFYMSDSMGEIFFPNSRFFFLLFLFVFSMFFLVFSGSWVVVLLGWDGLGLISFLLVIYYNNSSSLDSGLITVFTNRIGDSFFIVSFMFFFFNSWFSFDFLGLYLTFFFVFIICWGCFTKSAQVPFSSWLPAAMAAPTPVSSLVHSSTLVTAGVFLLIRFNYLFTSIFFFISIFSLLTMFLAGFCAIFEKDLKKVVAMSTLSQLGFMVLSISMGCWEVCFLHMVFHALFKSSLFLSTGMSMSVLAGDQDSRAFGALGSSIFTKLFFNISCISLMGFPFSLGFYSKDFVIGFFFSEASGLYFFVFIVSCVFTVCYSFRLICNSFFFFPSFFSSFSFEENYLFFLPVCILFMFCVFSGNFFFFMLTSPLVISFLECGLGSLVLFLGFLFYAMMNPLFFFDVFSHSVGFLSFFSTPLMSSTSSFLMFYLDTSWFELLGGQGVLKSVLFFYEKGLFFFFLSFSLFLYFFISFFVFFSFVFLVNY